MQRRGRDIGAVNMTAKPWWLMKRIMQTSIQCSGPQKKKIFPKKWNASENNRKKIFRLLARMITGGILSNFPHFFTFDASSKGEE